MHISLRVWNENTKLIIWFDLQFFWTASLTDQYGQNAVAEGAPPKQADPFDYGGGHVDANKALDPGLIYDMDRNDYAQFLCSMGYNKTAISWLTRSLLPCHAPSNFLVNLNLPSITIPALQRSLQVSRTVTNVGPVVSIYSARIQAPPGIKVRVEPSLLLFNSSVNKAMFKVTLCSKLSIQGSHSFGNLFWEDGHHVVRIPLIVRTIIPEFQVWKWTYMDPSCLCINSFVIFQYFILPSSNL